MKINISRSITETDKIALDWLISLARTHQSPAEAMVVGLSGHLGAGKTAFVKSVARHLGIVEDVTSPTFVIMKIYPTQSGAANLEAVPLTDQWHRLVHIDAYRLESREELDVLEWERLVSDKHNLIMIEWPENVGLKEFQRLCKLNLEVSDGAYVVRVE